MTENLGSTWCRWDLHFHTPSSFDYADRSVRNQDLVEGLLSAGIRVVAITDHHAIDTERIQELRRIAGEQLTILPGIELRSELGDKPVHYIGIFPETADLNELWTVIQGNLGLTPHGIRASGGDEGVYVELEKASKLFRKLGGLVSIHAGAKSNSIDSIQNKEQFQQRLKLKVAQDFVDLLEIGQIRDIARYKNIIFPATSLELPLIVGSDNHNIRQYDPPMPCWLKATPTFLGLRQVVNEPEERVYLGSRPRILGHVESNATRYIKSISISKRAGSPLEEHWFDDVRIDFNSGLVAIVGNKGSGKSALTDVIGLLGCSPHEEHFSFLTRDRFRRPRDNKASHFDAVLTWHSGDSVRRNLDESVQTASSEAVKYIPQRHLEAICDELTSGQEGRFERELKKVIYSRVPSSERLNLGTLDEIIEFRTREIHASIMRIQGEMRSAHREVVELERQASPSYEEELTGKLADAKQQLNVHLKTMPPAVQKPSANSQGNPETETLNQQVEAKAEEIRELDGEIASRQVSLARTTRTLEVAAKIRRALDNIQQSFNAAVNQMAPDCVELGLNPESLVNLNFHTQGLESLETQAKAERQRIRTELADEDPTSFPARRKAAKEALVEVRAALDRPNQEYQEYLQAQALWDKGRVAILGAESTPGTVRFFEARLAQLEQIPERLERARDRQISAALEIHGKKLELANVYAELYKAVQQFIDTHPLAREHFGLRFEVSMVTSGFEDKLLAFINHARRGSFRGEAEGYSRASALLAEADLGTKEGVQAFLSQVMDHLRYDRRGEEPVEILVADQLRQTYTVEELYEFVFGLDYLQPRFVLTWDGRPLEQLSPGERGTLLLVFFLLVDDDMTPLVIDQPEGNLDNQTVYEVLVRCIREAKRRRQIIIVTHNPNLAVVCDAEQVVCASLEKQDGNRVRYRSGALENPEVCARLVDVLEGTKPAIDKRVDKYRVIFN